LEKVVLEHYLHTGGIGSIGPREQLSKFQVIRNASHTEEKSHIVIWGNAVYHVFKV